MGEATSERRGAPESVEFRWQELVAEGREARAVVQGLKWPMWWETEMAQ